METRQKQSDQSELHPVHMFAVQVDRERNTADGDSKLVKVRQKGETPADKQVSVISVKCRLGLLSAFKIILIAN
jgi:hypothetical protein